MQAFRTKQSPHTYFTETVGTITLTATPLRCSKGS